MCPNCFEKDINKFESQMDFEEFEVLLDSKVNKGAIKVIEKEKNWHNNYICNTCNEHWTISVPENAWRGYFLPNAKAIAYEAKVEKELNSGSTGCIIFIVVIVIIASLIIFS